MTTQTDSFSADSSTAFAIRPSREVILGWDAMPALRNRRTDTELGWAAMPAFGESMIPASRSQHMAAEGSKSRLENRSTSSLLETFWSAISR